MTSSQKRKGSDFEREMATVLEELIEGSRWKRIPGSGAIGTIIGESMLTGDINGDVESIAKRFKVEAKVGYGGAKQFTLKKEWLDKVREEADASFGIPMLVGKFSGARNGVRRFVILEPEVFAFLINEITRLTEEVETLESK